MMRFSTLARRQVRQGPHADSSGDQYEYYVIMQLEFKTDLMTTTNIDNDIHMLKQSNLLSATPKKL